MHRNEALEKIAWHHLKHLTRAEATGLIIEFFGEPLKPSLREKLNITAVIQWETHEPPADLQPGNPIYRPVLIDKMKRSFRGATNEYLAEHLKNVVGLGIDQVEGDLPGWLPCPVCGHHTFETLGGVGHLPGLWLEQRPGSGDDARRPNRGQRYQPQRSASKFPKSRGHHPGKTGRTRSGRQNEIPEFRLNG